MHRLEPLFSEIKGLGINLVEIEDGIWIVWVFFSLYVCVVRLCCGSVTKDWKYQIYAERLHKYIVRKWSISFDESSSYELAFHTHLTAVWRWRLIKMKITGTSVLRRSILTGCRLVKEGIRIRFTLLIVVLLILKLKDQLIYICWFIIRFQM